MRSIVKAMMLSGAVAFGLGVNPVSAQHEHGEEEFEGTMVVFVMPTTYRGAVEEIGHRLHEILELMESNDLEEVDAQADVIKKVGKAIGRLALKEGSGVPGEAVKEVSRAGKDLAAKFDVLDKATDSGDAAGTRRVYNEMVKLTTTLQKYVPKLFACPMVCEGDKTYPTEGRCPKCGMKLEQLKAHADHEARHGGTFFMAADQEHHLEGTISGHNEYRIYFYDEYTKPIPAGQFTAEGKAWTPEGKMWTTGGSGEKRFTMRVGPRKEFLTAQVDPSISFPMRVRIQIDFKDGHKPQPFDFEFSEPSKEPTHEMHGEKRRSHKEHD